MPSPLSFVISELVQAQGCPVVRLGRVHVDWLNKASFGPGCEPGSRTLGGFLSLIINNPIIQFFA